MGVAFTVNDVHKGTQPAGTGEMLTVGKGFTVTARVLVATQVPVVPVIVYVIELLGVMVTIAPLVLLKPVAGAHV